jgi:hypothetical protein
MSEHALSDVLFPVGKVLRDVAEGNVFGDPQGPVGADNKASATANQNARRNPSGIDMQAEAAKAAARAKRPTPAAAPARRAAPAAPAPAAPAAPADTPRDHYAPKSSYGKIANND